MIQGFWSLVVSAVLMLGSPALADDLSGSTCAADVVLLLPPTQQILPTRDLRADDLMRRRSRCLNGKDRGYPCSLYGGETRHDVGLAMEAHAKSLMASPMLKGADIRFGIAGHMIDPLGLKKAGTYGDGYTATGYTSTAWNSGRMSSAVQALTVLPSMHRITSMSSMPAATMS